MDVLTLEPYRNNIVDRYTFHDLSPDQLVRYLGNIGVQTDIPNITLCLRAWGLPVRRSSVEAELEQHCESTSCTKKTGQHISWSALADLPPTDGENSSLFLWLRSIDALGQVPLENMSMGFKSAPTTFHATESQSSTYTVAPCTSSTLFSVEDNRTTYSRYADGEKFPYTRPRRSPTVENGINSPPKAGRRDSSACLLSPQSSAAPIRHSRLKSRGKRPATAADHSPQGRTPRSLESSEEDKRRLEVKLEAPDGDETKIA